MNAESLFDEWEAFSISKKNLKLTVDNLNKFYDTKRKSGPVKVESSAALVKTDLNTSTGFSGLGTTSSSSMDVDEPISEDTKNVKKRGRESSMDPVKPNSEFSLRKDRAKLDASFLGLNAGKAGSSSSSIIAVAEVHPNWRGYMDKGYLWNYNWETDVIETLSSRRDRLARLIMEQGNLNQKDTAQSGQVEAVYTGTISTGSAVGSHVDRKDLYLRRPDLKPIKLDLTELPNVSLFRGQVVALSGTNPQDRRLITHALYTIALPEPRIFDSAAIVERSRELSLMVAAGPYTCSSDLTYEPLNELLRQARVRKPAVLILMGPFVDEKHPLIASGRAQQTFPALFASVMEKIHSICETHLPQTKLIIVPSLNDVTHRSVLPQPAFRASSEPATSNQSSNTVPQDAYYFPDTTLRAPNPSVLRINNLDFGVMSEDVIDLLEQNSVISGTNNADKYTAFVSFLINQQSFFPIWPAPDEVHVDMNHAELGLTLPSLPDALFFASKHHPFIRTVHGVLAVNVGRLINEGTTGTYAEIKIAQSEVTTSTAVVQRSHVEVIRV